MLFVWPWIEQCVLASGGAAMFVCTMDYLPRRRLIKKQCALHQQHKGGRTSQESRPVLTVVDAKRRSVCQAAAFTLSLSLLVIYVGSSLGHRSPGHGDGPSGPDGSYYQGPGKRRNVHGGPSSLLGVGDRKRPYKWHTTIKQCRPEILPKTNPHCAPWPE